MTGEPIELTLDEIVALAKHYSDARTDLQEVIDDINERKKRAVQSRVRALTSRVADASAALDALKQAVRDNRDRFARPKTQSAHGIKFGWQKQPGKLVIADEDATIKLIRKRLGKRAASLIKRKETVDNAALRALPAADLARVGAIVTKTTDEVLVTVPKSDLDKIVAALMGDETVQDAEPEAEGAE